MSEITLGKEPAIILMHGFPDNLHLYDRVVHFLSPPQRIVLFDFLGWGASDKPVDYPYTAENQKLDLDAVVRQLQLGHVVLVAHDASRPPAIDWALANPERVAGLVLLNTYYGAMPTLRPPEASGFSRHQLSGISPGGCPKCSAPGSSRECITGK